MKRGRYVVWGYANSWVVHFHDGVRVTWASRWFPTKVLAQAFLDRILSQQEAG